MHKPIVAALWHPLNVLMALLAVFAGLMAAWWLFPVGLLFWGVMVWQVAQEPSLKINHEMQSRKPLPQRFQRQFTRLERAQLSVFNSLASAPAPARQALEPVQAEMARLVEEAHGLCERMTTLENYRLVTQGKGDFAAELARIDERIDGTQDSVTRREYQTARRMVEERLAKLEAASRQLERLDAQLLSMANTLDSVVAEVMHLQTQHATDASDKVVALVEQLRKTHGMLKAFERETAPV